MQSMNEKRLQELKVVYGIALAVIALTMLSSSFMMQYAIHRNGDESRIINLSGRQRMLSQRLTKSILALEHTTSDTERTNRLKEISESLAAWKAAHWGLQHGDKSLGLPARQNSAAITAQFAQLEPFHAAMAQAVEELLTAAKTGQPAPGTVSATSAVMLRNEARFLAMMDMITFQFDLEAKQRIGSMQRLERIILTVGLLVLLLEFLFVFRPSLAQLTVMMTSLKQQALQLRDELAERKLLEKETKELQLKNQQLQKTESLRRMAAAMSHLFNNQLQSVMGNLELALDEPHKSAEEIAQLTSAMQAAKGAADISKLLLVYIGQTVGQYERTDLSDLCRRTVPVLERLPPKNALLATDFPATGPEVNVNPNQWQQILINLVTNAGEAIGSDGGRIGLTLQTVSGAEIPAVHRFPVDWQPYAPLYACLEVTDTGCGIAPADIDKIFDPFFSSKFIGRGLGLPVALGLVRAHDGGITVESEPGKGSRFRVFLPAHPPAAAQPASPR